MIQQDTMNKMDNLHKNEITKLKEINKEFIANNNKKHDIEIKKLNEKYKIEKNEWIQIMNKKYNKEFKEKELKMIELVKKQQEDEIDVIIDKLSNEYMEKIKLLQSEHEKVLDQHKNEIYEEKEESKEWIKQFEALNVDIKNMQNEHSQKIS